MAFVLERPKPKYDSGDARDIPPSCFYNREALSLLIWKIVVILCVWFCRIPK